MAPAMLGGPDFAAAKPQGPAVSRALPRRCSHILIFNSGLAWLSVLHALLLPIAGALYTRGACVCMHPALQAAGAVPA